MSFSSSSLRSCDCSSPGINSTGGFKRWASELDSRIILVDIPLEDYLEELVPCSFIYEAAEVALNPNAFSNYQPGKGSLAVKCIPEVRAGLEALVSDFEEEVRLTFWESHDDSHDYRFPLSSNSVDHSKSSPDISVSFPGATDMNTTIKSSRWEVISMCIEAKDSESKDPFPTLESAKSDVQTIVRLARNARTLMLVHGFLYSFVLGIYGNTVRIARIDRTVCIVSRPFNLHENIDILKSFFWHFTHPIVGSPVVGCDPTIRCLTTAEDAWLQKHLSRTGVRRTSMDVFMTRRVEVYNDEGGTMVPYFVYQLVDVNPRLMSRSTMVWRAIKDTYEEDQRAEKNVKSCILKDSWRPLVRRPEIDFYRRIAGTISDEERWGLPKMVIGGDIGQLELRSWETCSPNAEYLTDERHLKSPTTASTAGRTTLAGHRLAWEKAGLLHRDISLGNILIVVEPNKAGFVGFLHDFDYSSMTEPAPDDLAPASTSYAPRDVDKPELRERTGTRYFMACELLRGGQSGVVHRVYHDLESYYWVLLWLILQHTHHNLGHAQLEEVFEFDDLSVALRKKTRWLWGGFWDEDDKLIVQDNAPLTDLMASFKRLVTEMCTNRYQSKVLTYQSVLDLFDHALAQPGWPINDRVQCTLLYPRFQQDDREGLCVKPIAEIRSMAVNGSGILRVKKHTATVAALDVCPHGAEDEAGPCMVREDGPSNPKRRKCE
ncbi:hypothetical protein L226DRAFT_526400 [Lentinus tigrinus ALCF2SS1-7]|uniref:uncharacterized protein n=1 Tax=Lentinus tigrinus ALCF2SS1-7 TaxID=1328758 RepID=UPI0011660CF7|nr:hypothetical protein L226DRAFT_526400 [Lentinus tigrinus ALCF2SS1-7]